MGSASLIMRVEVRDGAADETTDAVGVVFSFLSFLFLSLSWW